MQVWLRRFAAAGVLALAGAVPSGMTPADAAGRAAAFFPAQLTEADSALYRSAFASLKVGAWDEALTLAAAAQAPLPAKVIRWLYYAEPGTTASFAEIAAFLDGSPHWPLAYALTANAERALVEQPGRDAEAVDWFLRHPPVTGAGMARFAVALRASGRAGEADDWARRAWTGTSLSYEVETELLSEFGEAFSAEDDSVRMEWLLWRGVAGEAERMLGRLEDGERLLAIARIALRERRSGVDARIAAVPADLRDDPRLSFERVRWRRRAGNEDGAVALLLESPQQTGPESYWWTERENLARRAIGGGDWRIAYDIVRQHGQSDRARVSEAEWTAGWIALRYLDDAESAYLHFGRQHAVVRTPVSLARAAYWSARAAEALDEDAVARSWFEEAARYPTTFYGQLGLAALPGAGTVRLPADPAPTLEEADGMAAQELALVCVLLAELNQEDRLRPFLNALMDEAGTAGEMQLVLRLASVLGRPDVSVNLSKTALRGGLVLPEAGWPVLSEALESRAVEPALVLAVIRQESEFNEGAVSPAGARGLMQLMPATARGVAAAIRVRYDRSRLTEDIAYNVRLGTSHLADLLEVFDGSYVLSVAAYNAGEARVRSWMRAHGDPRGRRVNVIDWIERIPIDETRNYVQRVLENLQVYRAVLAGGEAQATIVADLNR